MKKIFTAILAATFCTALFAQTEVTDYRPGVTAEGITYFLPKTAFHVTVTAQRVVHHPGEYCQYAERYLRLRDVPQQQYEEWAISKVKVASYGVADKTQAYTIKLKSKTSAPLVRLSADGRLLAVNTNSTPAEPQLSSPYVQLDTTRHQNPADFKTEEILAAGSVSKMAELTANEIYDIRENRSLLTKGQADFMPKDGEQLRLMLAQLDTQEEGLLQLFKGTVSKETHVFTLDYVPSGVTNKEILFRFSKHLGLVDKDDLAGAPYYISVADLHALPDEEPAEGKSKKPIEDLRYIVPGKGNISIANGQRVFYSGSFPMSQFGRVEHLGAELFNKKMTTHVHLSPVTGGITNIEASE